MSDTFRQASEQSGNRIEALERQISAAKENIKNWEKQLADEKALKELIDSKLPKVPTPKPAAAN